MTIGKSAQNLKIIGLSADISEKELICNYDRTKGGWEKKENLTIANCDNREVCGASFRIKTPRSSRKEENPKDDGRHER
jgi:hypothetical protein